MPPVRSKLVIGGTAILAALGYLATSGIRSGWVYYLSVDAYASMPEARDARSRVHGTVGPDPDSRPAEFAASFVLLGESASIPVEYHGPVPDLFAVGREVVVEGATDGRGVFVAEVLLTKCGSKYEAAGESPGGLP